MITAKYLAELEELRLKSDDCSAECLLDRVNDENFSYEEYDDDEWTQDCKYQSRTVEFLLPDGLVYGICESRSGSPFTDWYNQLDNEWYAYDPLDVKVLVEFFEDCGRLGELSGLFICTKRELQELESFTHTFSDVLGKHSEISVTFDDCLTVKSTDVSFINKLQDVLKCGNTISGINCADLL